ncbi:hypothetical protein BX666DRAFT_607175 [Dichotomocladium elegans]|nr:hypothetical protein BX666DRAFT_607175 [Dichotomocladium elegans]
MLHLTSADRKTRFHMIPRAHWVPDQLAPQCQFERGGEGGRQCSTQFSFFQRRHHCRRCGMVVCQRHSGNRLPLFPKPNSLPKWSRVCDRCFRGLIMTD